MKKILLLALCSGLALASVFAQIPPAPTNLVAQLVSTPGTVPAVKLTWQHTINHATFKVYRSINDTSHFQPIGTTGMLQFLDYGTFMGGTFYYFVKALGNSVGQESPRSNIASITVVPPVLPPRGVIRGTVIDDSTLAPIRHAVVRFFRFTAINHSSPMTYTDSLGRYQASLDTGTYLIKAEVFANFVTGPLYRPEWFDNAPDPSTATPVAVAESSLFVANFALTRLAPPSYAFINGRVTDTAGVPLRNASVAVLRTMQEMAYLAATTGTTPGLGEEIADLEGVGHTRGVVWRGRTDSLGNYHARVIAGRPYIAMASKIGFLPEFFDNKTNPTEADVIFLGRDTSGIDFSLAVRLLPQNSISGWVRDSLGTGVPSRIALIPVAIAPFPNLVPIRFGHTDSTGVYTISNVHAGKYFVRALPFSGYGPAFYKAGAYGVVHWQDADSVNITGNITGIDVGVVPITSPGLVRLSGRVRASNGSPLNGVVLVARTSQGTVVGCGFTDGSGSYAIDAIPSGAVTVSVDRTGFAATDRNITVPSSTFSVPNIDYTLNPSSPTSVSPLSVPAQFILDQNYPNPFNPSTTISFNLQFNSVVSLTVYNLLGQEVATILKGEVTGGKHDIIWNGIDDAGRGVASGLYFYRLKATSVSGGQEFSQMKKMVLLK